MRQPTFALLSLLFLASSLTTAAPHDTATSPYAAGTYATTHNPSLRPWRRLSDAIIRRLWRLPDSQKSLAREDAQDGGNALVDKLVAQYSENVVLRFRIRTAEEARALAHAADVLFLDVWEFNHDWADLRLNKDRLSSLMAMLPKSLQASHEPLLQDFHLTQAIFNTYPSPHSTHPDDNYRFSPNIQHTHNTAKGHPFFQDYQPLSVIDPWMNLMSSMFTTHVRRINIGISYEGRDIPALRVGVHPTNNQQPSKPRKTVVITGGLHAREWISTSTVNYLAWSLINGYGKHREMTRLLEDFDFVFVPTLNPDGYVYSWETDRLWRKNRQPTSRRFCFGLDLDRSYPYKWDGESSYPCSESFPGDAPFQGVEAARFAEWAKNETENNNVEIVGFLDLHSYSQQILYPYSYSCDEEPPSIEDLEELALGLAKAIRVSRTGQTYKVTSACEGNVAFANQEKYFLPRIESSGGSALDFFYHELKVRYSYQIKLRDTGSYGFLLPKENIMPTGEEMLDALLYFGRFMLGEVGMAKEERPLRASKPARDDDDSGVDWNCEDCETEAIEL
ncbi:putative metallocarboxypeptidase ECM14 [Decorospora gaudefroyi]|uniref:Inactive metallocarboxypeptidase ECM14 n=1 Tax=Decorospora gaudefroyi TaxID=184978 RepID=A0A6A5K8A1_9PLEO|nr:putative metallocarboxypeptidase ECM14 [Decorospora gaudefroyi]